LSAVYGFALDTAAPVVALAEHYGAGIWKGNVAYLFANSGAFVTVFVYTMWLARRNRTLGEFRQLAAGDGAGSLGRNYMLAVMTGTLWYGQFFFYNLGHVRLGPAYAFSSWAIHMIMLVLISNALGMVLREWKGCRRLTRAALAVGLGVLCCAVSMLTYGNYLGERGF
jgi:L-rhamnose-H+ transport protein